MNAYGVMGTPEATSQKGYRNEIWPVRLQDGRMVNVSFFKREQGSVRRIRNADAVSEYLADQGMPTRRRIDSRILQIKNASGVTNVGMYTYLPGETISWESYSMTHIKLLGKTMSDMHHILAHVPEDFLNLESVYAVLRQNKRNMEKYFADANVIAAMSKKLGVSVNIERLAMYKKVFEEVQNLPLQQPLHMDFVRGNVLFDKPSPQYEWQLNGVAISGILDFEKTAKGHPVVDVARTLAFLLVDCKYKKASRVYKYFLQSGYHKRGRSHDVGTAMMRLKLVEFFLLYDFYKFLRHNPYEFLETNEHFVRTRDMLKRLNVVSCQ